MAKKALACQKDDGSFARGKNCDFYHYEVEHIIRGTHEEITLVDVLVGNIKNQHAKDYGGWNDETEYYEAKAKLEKAQRQFMSLPPQIRSHFDNDVGKAIAYLNSFRKTPWKPTEAKKG